ncbi:tudor domain-containing protein 5 isoform X2 [Betta splendens]|uniref:Tudor domain-containing protein 5 n=1 Tax=Betta splendens TaxID=158456 RepID=A0A6P7M9H0_BETSP|nr:tudor domain-containing protein 5 isoform X2 [Betta splendens]
MWRSKGEFASKMSQEDVLATLKKDVRSLLISSKMGLDANQLKQDYFKMLGHPMPLKQLGFKNIFDMMKEIPDVVSINLRPDGSHILKAVGNKSTQSIENLVAKQRVSKTDIRQKLRRRGDAASFMPRYGHRPSSVLPPRRGCAPLMLPAQLRAQLHILLSQGPLRLCDLEACYLSCFGHPLRVHNYGFYSTGEMLGAAADLVLIQQSRLGSIVKLREPMLHTTLHKPLKSRLKDESKMRPGYVQTQAVSPAKVAVNKSPLNQMSVEPTLVPVLNGSAAVGEKSNVEKNQEAQLELGQKSQPFQNRILELEEELRLGILENGLAGTISQDLKDNMRKVVSQHSSGLSVQELPCQYKKVFGEDLPLVQNGFVSVTELVGAMSDIFRLKPVEYHNGSDWVVMDLEDKVSTQSDLNQTRTVGVKQPFMSYYLSCGESPWESKQDGEDAKTTADDATEGTQETMSNMYATIHVRHSHAVPPDALLSQRLKPPTCNRARELVEVVVERVVSPGHFYIRFSKSKEALAMEDMMIDMRRCYTNPAVSQHYRLPEQLVRRGQVCCVSPEQIWFYRVVIHRIVSLTQVEVYYVDFGNMNVVQNADLKFLKSSYSVLPAQAVPSSLAGIVPNTGNWTAAATASFKNLCSDRTLVGALDFYTGDVLQLYLCDTHTPDDIYIHTVLLSQGHGAPCSPSACTALCVQVNPVSLYLGEGKVKLPEVDVTAISRPNSTDSQFTLKIDKEEMPGLELYEDIEDSLHLKENPFSVLITKQHTRDLTL